MTDVPPFAADLSCFYFQIGPSNGEQVTYEDDLVNEFIQMFGENAEVEENPSTEPDPRGNYVERILDALNLLSADAFYDACKDFVAEDVVYVTTWLHRTPRFRQARYVEVQELHPIGSYMEHLISTVPDVMMELMEKKLYRRQNGTSFIMARVRCSGRLLLDLLMTNFKRTSQTILKRIGLTANFFRMAPTAVAPAPVMQQQQQRPISYTISEDAMNCDYLDIGNDDQPAQFMTAPGYSNNKQKDILDTSIIPTNKRKRPASMMQREFFNTPNVRTQVLQEEQVEIATSESRFHVEQKAHSKKPLFFCMMTTFVIHIRADMKVERWESFKRIEWRNVTKR